ncbi:MAG TPA: DUF998 domain-containing protein [Acidimicrobiales bacterium]|nr:DUF998 domain-containing protein [Acidimicrobiales bacterium]
MAFVTAWAALGAGAGGYDPTRDAISRLAALGAPTRPAMTAGLVALAAGMGLYGVALRPRPGWLLPVANGVVTLAVAALPLGGRFDAAHGVAAALGYATLAAIPAVVGRRPLSIAIGLVSALCLLLTVLTDDRDGLFQRLGLTVAQAWVVLSALALVRSPTPSSTTPPAPAPAGRRR